MSALPTMASTAEPPALEQRRERHWTVMPFFDYTDSPELYAYHGERLGSQTAGPELGAIYGHIAQFLVRRARYRDVILHASTEPLELATEQTEQESYRRRVCMARLREAGRTAAVEQLAELMAALDEEADEPDLSVESLMSFTDFLVDQHRFGTPAVGIDADGQIQAEWQVLSEGLLVMNFRNDGLIRFVAVSGPARVGSKRMRLSGTLQKRDALRAIEPFLA